MVLLDQEMIKEGWKLTLLTWLIRRLKMAIQRHFLWNKEQMSRRMVSDQRRSWTSATPEETHERQPLTVVPILWTELLPIVFFLFIFFLFCGLGMF